RFDINNPVSREKFLALRKYAVCDGQAILIRRLAEKLWSASRKESRPARTIVPKLKTSELKILTRSHTPSTPPSSCAELTDIALTLRGRVDLGPKQRFRLVGIGLSNFEKERDEPAQLDLFE